MAKERLLLHKKRREAAPVQLDIFFAVPPRLENNGPVLRESACAEDEEDLAMNNLNVWTTQYQQPLLLACGGLLALALLLKCGERRGRLQHLLSLVIVLAAAAVIFLGKDEKSVWIPALAALLVAAAQEVLKWKPTADSSAAADQTSGVRQHEERLRAVEQQLLALQASGAVTDDKGRHKLEQELKDVQGQLANLQKSYEEKQQLLEETSKKLEQVQRLLSATRSLEQVKSLFLPDARIEKAQVSLRQGDTKAAKEIFAEVRRQAGKTAALAAHHEGKLAEGEVNYAEAMELYRTAALLEKDNPDYLLAAGNMARKLAEYKQAQEWLERLLELREKEGKNDAALGDALHELALLYKDLGQYAAAEPLYLRAVAVKEQAFGKEHPDVAEVLNDLAVLYRREGKYAEAEQLQRRSLKLRKETLGEDHPAVAASLNNLAELYRVQDRYAEAEPLYMSSLKIYEKTLGKEHPAVASALSNLAVLYRTHGRYEEAESLFKRSLAIRKKTMGENHPDVATALNSLAVLYWAQGMYEESESLFHNSIVIREEKFDKDHLCIAFSLRNIANLYRDQGRYAEAEPLYQRALSIMQAKLPAGHSRISGCQKDYDDMKEKMAGM